MKKYIVAILLFYATSGQLLFAQSLFLEWQTCLGGSSDDQGNFMKLVVGNQGFEYQTRTAHSNLP